MQMGGQTTVANQVVLLWKVVDARLAVLRTSALLCNAMQITGIWTDSRAMVVSRAA